MEKELIEFGHNDLKEWLETNYHGMFCDMENEFTFSNKQSTISVSLETCDSSKVIWCFYTALSSMRCESKVVTSLEALKRFLDNSLFLEGIVRAQD